MHNNTRNRLCALPRSLWAIITLCIAGAAAPVQLDDAWVDASRYAPGAVVQGSVVLRNTSGAGIVCTVAVQVTHLAAPVATVSVPVALVPAAGVTTATFAWLPPARDFTGYLLELSATAGGTTSAPITTAVDVSSDWRVFPRYGYISAYGALSSAEINATIEQLNRYHLNGLQFYDWQNYKHHIPLAGTVADPASSWPDIANRDNRFLTVTRYLTAAHARRMTCMNYNLLYGASSNCYADGLQPQWGLYDDASHTTQTKHGPLPGSWATPYINVFNPLHADWRNWIFNEEEKVFKVFGFDGWHVDQLGRNGYSWEGNSIDMASAYGSFLSAARARLGKRYTFNAINEWGAANVAGEVDFLYVEAWPGSSETTSRYLGFQWMFEHCRSWSGNLKNIVFAAYMNRNAAAFNTTSVLLADAAIYATGGAHLELGDHGLLSTEYFPSTKPASATLMTRLRRYYDVITAYQNMLRDRDVITITREVASATLPLSTWDEPGHVWSFARRYRNMEILHLINLTSLTTNAWNDANGTYAAPTVVSNVTLQYFTTQRVDRVTLVSPDYALGAPVAVTFSTNPVGGRACVTCTLPYLQYWSMLLFRAEPRTWYISAAALHTFDGRTPATAFRTIYEADQAINYSDGDTILIDAGTTNGALGYVYDHGGPAGAVSRFQRLRDTTTANDITIAGINGMPVIVAEYPPVQLHGVRFNCVISNLAFVVSNGPAVAVANQSSYAADPNVGVSARWYPASGGNMVIAQCLISNVTAASAIVLGVNGAFDGRETADIYTVLKGAQILGNRIHVAGAGAVAGALRFNQYGGGTDVLIANNTIRGPGMSAGGAADAINVAWNNGKDTAFVISNNQLHGWSGRALALDIGASEIRENLMWDVGGPAVQVDGGVAGGTPNIFVNNTIWNVNGNCAQTQYDSTATNWWVNNLFLRAAGSAYVCWSGGGARNMFDACLSDDVLQMYNTDATEAGANYWYYDPGLVTTNRNSDAFLALEYHTSSTQALYGGAARYGGRSWLGVGGGIQGGAPLDIPEPTAVGYVLLLLYMARRTRMPGVVPARHRSGARASVVEAAARRFLCVAIGNWKTRRAAASTFMHISKMLFIACAIHAAPAHAAARAWHLVQGAPAHPYPLANATLASNLWQANAGLPAPHVTIGKTNALIEMALQADETLVGAGNWHVCGTCRVVWCADTYAAHDPAYFAVPFLISSRGYGIFINCSGRVVMDCGANDPRTLRITVPEPGVDAYVFHGTPREITEAYTALIGRPRPVPPWVFTPWFSRNSYMSAKEIDNVLAEGRTRGFRPGAVVLECWAESLQNFKFATDRYPNPVAWIAGLHTQGVQVILWETPSIFTHAASYAAAASNDFLVRNADGSELIVSWLDGGRKIDFRKPAARQWWQALHAPLIAMGVDGFKTDGGERMPDPFFHNLHPYFYQKTVLDAFAQAGREGITFARAATPPCAGLATFWAGDQPAEWPFLSSLIRLGLGAAIAGFPFWGHDIGSYTGTPSQELYLRWLQFGTFTPLMQLHGVTPREPWYFGATVERIARNYFAIRERLQPYLIATASNVYSHGAPLMRPMAWAYPQCAEAWNVTDAYLFGEALLVAPITTPAPRAPIPTARLRTPDGQPGLRGEYFNNMQCSGTPVTAQRDATVDFNWRQGKPAAMRAADHFSARWTGTLGPAPATGVYAITVACDDGARLWLDDTLVIDEWTPRPMAEHTVLVTLTQGQTCRVKLDYYENMGEAQCRLLWSPPGPAQAQRRVWLPPGTWMDAWSGTRHTGPGYLMCSTSLEHLPVFIAARHYRALHPVFAPLK